MIESYGEHVLIHPIEKEEGENKTSTGIILVADLDTELPRGIVVSKGADVPEWVNIGDKVIFNEQYVADISSDGTDYVSTNYKALLGREV